MIFRAADLFITIECYFLTSIFNKLPLFDRKASLWRLIPKELIFPGERRFSGSKATLILTENKDLKVPTVLHFFKLIWLFLLKYIHKYTRAFFVDTNRVEKEKIFENQTIEIPSYEYTEINGFIGTPFSEVIPNQPEESQYAPAATIETRTYKENSKVILFKGGQSKAQWTYSAKEGYNQILYKYNSTLEYK